MYEVDSSKNTNCTEDSEKDIGAVGGEETETDENHQRQKQTNRNQAIIPVNQEESVWPLQGIVQRIPFWNYLQTMFTKKPISL